MPVYEYHCKKCDANFEVWKSATENGTQRCPTCNGKADKIFHAPGIIFKGSGFHVTDYGKKDTKEPAPAAATCPKAADKSCPGCEKS